MNAVLVGVDGETHPKSLSGNQLLGQNVSSLHRLKDINNKGAYASSSRGSAGSQSQARC